MTKIKFCGLKSLRDVEYVNLCRPDYVGFVFWPKSKRFVERELAEQMKGALAPGITAVGVFVDEAPEKVASSTWRSSTAARMRPISRSFGS